MPKFLKNKCSKEPGVDKKLRDTFGEFKAIQATVTVDHYKAKYVEVYEKGFMCGKHLFRLKNVSIARINSQSPHNFELAMKKRIGCC